MAQIQKYDVRIIGGGAAGFFAAAELLTQKPHCKVAILERSSKLLSKVLVSGGGRCNVTHHCFDPEWMAARYPRGNKELRGPLTRFGVSHTLNWFLKRGVPIVAEADGRMFPRSNSSHSIAQCLMDSAKKAEVHTLKKVVSVIKEDSGFTVACADQSVYGSSYLIVATGGHSKEAQFDYLQSFALNRVPPVPSLFTFNLGSDPITQLQGLSVAQTRVTLPEHKMFFDGPTLITHWGLSGPAVLKLSAFAARALAEKQYQYIVEINRLPHMNAEEVFAQLKELKNTTQRAVKLPFISVPKRLGAFIIASAGVPNSHKWADCSHDMLRRLSKQVTQMRFFAQGKTTYKDEFVTSGGVHRKEVDFRTMQARRIENLFFAGEVIDIDGITGGFNFQAAWTTAYLAACTIADRLSD